MSSDEQKFNPNKHMRVFERRQRQRDGSYKTVKIDYLDVKWRIVWFREEHPEGSIETLLKSTPGEPPAVMQATVRYVDQYDDQGKPLWVTVTGWGQCDQDDWSDWLEKAETRAIGRALALAGYGTQFCEDFEEVIADGPVDQGERRQPQQRNGGSPARRSGGETGELMTANQQKYIFSLAREAGLPNDELDEIVHARFGHGMSEVLKSEASALIGSLQELRDERQLAGAAG